MGKRAFAPRQAKTVRGGLRPQSGRRDAWWRRRLMEWLEGLRIGPRLGRGRNYAQQGQIRALTVRPGQIDAEVQGAEAAPYYVSLRMAPLDQGRVRPLLRARPMLMARLAARALPIALEETLAEAGMSLFPPARDDLAMACDCRDWARPCKHLAAVFCLFADASAADPALLLRFRGIVFPDAPPNLTPRAVPEAEILRLHPSTDAGLVPRRLGPLPYWRGDEPFQQTLESAYRRAQGKALAALDGHADLRFPEDTP